jgi:hypothetical protein
MVVQSHCLGKYQAVQLQHHGVHVSSVHGGFFLVLVAHQEAHNVLWQGIQVLLLLWQFRPVISNVICTSNDKKNFLAGRGAHLIPISKS